MHPPATCSPRRLGLALRGPIPRKDGGVAVQRGTRYVELRFGHAVARRGEIVVHLTEAPLPCDQWLRTLALTFHIAPGPDGKWFAGRTVTSHIEYIHRGFGHVRLEPVDPVDGKHIRGRIAYSDPGSGMHNGPVVVS